MKSGNAIGGGESACQSRVPGFHHLAKEKGRKVDREVVAARRAQLILTTYELCKRAEPPVDTPPRRRHNHAEMSVPRRYSVVVAKDFLKFSAAHFIAYPGFREPLHGHNYQVSVRVDAALGPEGYVLDFGLVKRVARALCEELDERVLLPARSECLRIVAREEVVEVETEDGGRFCFPAADVRLLPIGHSSAEELAAYLLGRLRTALAAETAGRQVLALEVGVAEAPGQVASCREEL